MMHNRGAEALFITAAMLSPDEFLQIGREGRAELRKQWTCD
jgi:hypothetical protein